MLKLFRQGTQADIDHEVSALPDDVHRDIQHRVIGYIVVWWNTRL